ncbi:MAG TPA: hypothetical protein VG672_10770, partial [Bryobacteraceae bacterium]|nr:hypothetical protein [Bryobacteraceae bacterium]
PNNTIPVSRQNSITTTILNKWVPLPNTATVGATNWISNDPQALTQDQFDWRIDHRFSDKDSIFGHYIYEDNDFALPRLFPTDGARQRVRGQHGMAAWTHLFGSTTLNDFRLGYSRFAEFETQARAGKENVVAELGMTGLCENPACWGIPQQVVTGFAQFGEHGGQAVSGPRGWRNEFFQFQDSFYKTKGAHQIRFGGSYRRHRDNFPEAIQPRGQYTYTGFLTGQAFGDYLLGYPLTTVTSIDIFSPHLRNSYFDLWAQDDWRVSSELTINVGLRYEWAGRPSSDDGSISSVLFQNNTATLVTGRDPHGLPTSLAYNDNNNLAPRIGLAYSPKALGGRTVMRAAYGIFYQRELANTWIDLAINAPFVRQTQFNLDTTPTSPFYWRNYNLANPTAIVPPASALLAYTADPNWRDGFVQQWNFNIQQALGHNTVLQVAYVGNHAIRLPWEIFPNQPDPAPGPVQQRRPYSNFGTLYTLATGGNSNYHGLQISLEKRYSSGIQFILGYTYAKCISDSDSTFVGEGTSIQNGRDGSQQRGLCTQDFRQRLTASFLYDLPFGKGKAFLSQMPRVGDLLLGGWQVNGIYTARTGSPYTVSQSGDYPNVGDGTARPDLVGDPTDVTNKSIDNWFNTSAFRMADRYRWGTEGRNVLIGPGINNWDLSLFKNFNFDDKRRLQFRGEFFNAFNRTEFALPGAVIGTAQFGKISGTSRDPRDIQLSLKFLW